MAISDTVVVAIEELDDAALAGSLAERAVEVDAGINLALGRDGETGDARGEVWAGETGESEVGGNGIRGGDREGEAGEEEAESEGSERWAEEWVGHTVGAVVGFWVERVAGWENFCEKCSLAKVKWVGWCGGSVFEEIAGQKS
jgi:hypothetical protein